MKDLINEVSIAGNVHKIALRDNGHGKYIGLVVLKNEISILGDETLEEPIVTYIQVKVGSVLVADHIQHLMEGDQISFTGFLITDSWERDGKTAYQTRVQALQVNAVDYRSELRTPKVTMTDRKKGFGLSSFRPDIQ